MRYTYLLAAMLVCAGPAEAQEPPEPQLTGDNLAIYSAEQRDPFIAGVMEFILPTLGYGYARNWDKGAGWLAATITGAVMMEAVVNDGPGISGTTLLAIAGARMLAIANATFEAREFNRALRDELLLNYNPADGGRFAVGLRVPIRPSR